MVVHKQAVYVNEDCIEYDGQKFQENDIVDVQYHKGNQVYEATGRIKQMYSDNILLDTSEKYHWDVKVVMFHELLSIKHTSKECN